MTITESPIGEKGTMADTATSELSILFGSQTGNAEYLAHQIHGKAAKKTNDVMLSSLEEWLAAGRPALQRLLVVTSTHDNGHMPDNAQEFWDWLQSLESGVLDGLPYAVLSIGDSMYDDFCKAGHDIDERLEALGAVRVVAGIDCDIDFEFSAGKWSGPAVEALLAADAWSGALAESNEPRSESAAAPSAESQRVARISASRRLSKAGSGKDVTHYELSFDDEPFDYQPGDSIAIFPSNSTSIVDEWMSVFGDQELPADADGRTLGEILRFDMELRLPHPGLIVGLARLRPDSDVIRGLVALIESGNREELDAWLWGRDVLDVLTDLECLDLPIADILGEMRPLQHRDYSIASSPLLDDGRVHITVGGVNYLGSRGAYRGVATDFLADRAHDGASFVVRRLPAHEFHLPSDESPIIMIGPGVGVAPFRAFLRHRHASGATGQNWLFFGDQHRDLDWLYEEEFTEYARSGVLERVDVAFSRDQAEKHYVQDEMRKNAAEMRSWIDAGAYVFVCGDKRRMAQDVDRALATILVPPGGAQSDGLSAVAVLKSSGRYVKDVY